MKKLLYVMMLSALLCAKESTFEIEKTLNSNIFHIGQKNFNFGIGTSNEYTVVGVNINYFVIDNLSIGVGYQGWFGDDPSMQEINVPMTYYFPLSETYHPYLGGIYRHTFVEKPYEDYDVFGLRAGLAMHTGGNGYISVGWIQEYSDYGEKNKSEGYPEISFAIAF